MKNSSNAHHTSLTYAKQQFRSITRPVDSNRVQAKEQFVSLDRVSSIYEHLEVIYAVDAHGISHATVGFVLPPNHASQMTENIENCWPQLFGNK